ncbi:YfcC family protein [Anaeromicropila populeti]|nr:AbgT family transporter [Anaeromicropila populeti]
MLHTFAFLFLIIVLASLLTYMIPAGNFQRVENQSLNQTVVVPNSYKQVESSPVAPYKIFHKIFEAFCQEKTASLIFFILIIGGVFEIIMQTGCMISFCESILKKFMKKELLIIPVFVTLFSVFGFTMGLTTASVIFVPLGIAAAQSLKLDRMTGIAMVALGTNAGFTAGIFNPFSVGTAQIIAELPLYSGIWLRCVVLVVINFVTSLYLMYYAKKQRDKNINHSMEEEQKIEQGLEAGHKMTKKQIIILTEFAVSFLILTIGISAYKWQTADITAAFLLIGNVIGFSAGFGINQICNIFTEGCSKMIKGILVIGLAATIRLILSEGNILDTITYELTALIYHLPQWAQLLGIFFFNAAINLLITSGSAKAALVMPIFTPMADCLGLSRQSAVFAFQLGDGLTNLYSPVSTTLNGVLSVSEESYGNWVRFYTPLVGIYMIAGALLTILASAVSY